MGFFNILGNNMFDALKEILKSPFRDFSIWWILAPVFILWVVLELYFAKHQNEELGWNTALGNGISLAWITVTLMKYLFENNMVNFNWLKFIIVLLIMCYGFFVAYTSFKHYFSPETTFLLASPSPIYYLSTIAILWSYNVLEISLYVILDLIIIYLIVIGIFALIRKYMPIGEDNFLDTF